MKVGSYMHGSGNRNKCAGQTQDKRYMEKLLYGCILTVG